MTLQTTSGLLEHKKKDHQELRRSLSECVHHGKDVVEVVVGSPDDDAAQTVMCACCSVTEECTAGYIGRVRAAHGGSWVCGLCAEAVGERLRREPGAGAEAALRWHAAVCRDFNATTRLNPKLSLAGTMRDIARRSLDRRASASATMSMCHDDQRCTAKTMARTVSCQPRFFA